MANIHPEVLWAQRTDVLFLTVGVSEVCEEKLEITADSFAFSGKFGPQKTPFSVTLNFFAPIDKDKVKRTVSGPATLFYIHKAEEGPYWPRLTKETQKLHYIKTDFARWKDEDEEEEEESNRFGADGGMGGFDFSQFAGGNAGDFADESNEHEAEEEEGEEENQ